MAKVKEDIKEQMKLDPSARLGTHLTVNKDKHLNFVKKEIIGISSGSMNFDMQLGGFLNPGFHSFNGTSGGGKSSSALSFMGEFLKEPNRRAVYFQAERLLSKKHKDRTSINFIESDDFNNWSDQTCYLYTGHIFEDVITLIRDLVSDSKDNKIKYLFVIDSVNALLPEGDSGKSFSESLKVAGGALLSSHFLRTLSLDMSTLSHFCFMIGQVRSKVQINPYDKTPPKLSNASGSFALEHYSENIFEFQKPYGADYIYKDAAKKELLGKYAKVIIRKTNLENEGITVTYPLKFNQEGKNSIWREYEILDMLEAWQKIKKAGAWLSASEELIKLLNDNKFSIKEKFQEKELLNTLEEDRDLSDFLFIKCKNLAIKGRFED